MDTSRWLFLTVFWVFMLMLAGLFLGMDDPLTVFVISGMQQLIFALGGFLGMYHLAPHTIDLNLIELRRGALAGIALFLLNTLAGLVVFAIGAWLFGFEAVTDVLYRERQGMEQMLDFARVRSVIPLFLLVVVAAPIGEEFFFRGFLLSLLRRRTSTNAAIAVTALLFAVMHFYILGFLSVLVSGVFLGWLYVASNNIWRPIMAHGVSNAVVLVLSLFI